MTAPPPQRGVLLRHLLMPGLLEEGRQIMAWVARELGRDTFVNIMGQYSPAASPLLATGEQRSRCVCATAGVSHVRTGRGVLGGRCGACSCKQLRCMQRQVPVCS